MGLGPDFCTLPFPGSNKTKCWLSAATSLSPPPFMPEYGSSTIYSYVDEFKGFLFQSNITQVAEALTTHTSNVGTWADERN